MSIVAMAPMPGKEGAQEPSAFYFIGMMVLMMAIFYVILIRPQRRREQERRNLIDNVKTGDRILFSGGILGTIANVKEKTFTVKIAEKVKIEVSRSAVSQVLEKGEDPPEAQSK
jgi:preprotein translocase subunit YajC